MTSPTKFWWRGLPLSGVSQPELTGGESYWWRGLPLPVLSGFFVPPPPPPAIAALPTAARLALLAEDDWSPLATRRFSPPAIQLVVLPATRWRAPDFDEPEFRAPASRRFAPPPVVTAVVDDGFTYVVF
jgi:hypothetical protein